MTKTTTLLFATCLLSTIGGCSSDSQDTPPIEDRADARLAADAVVGRLSGLDPESANLQRGSEDMLRAFEVSIDVAGDLGCLDGGNLSFDGEAEGSADLAEQMASFDVDIDFHACRFDDVQIDGGLSHTATVAHEAGDATVDYHYAGQLVFDGAIQGSCAFDFSAHVEREPGLVTAVTTYSGQFCDFDAADLGLSVQIDVDG